MADRLEGKASIVTGAGKGIGRSIAQVFAAEGAKVLVADIDEEAARATAADLGRTGAEAAALRVDVSSAADAEAMARAAIERFGRIDVLCQNAGVYPEVRIAHMTEADWDRVHAINLKGTFLRVKACLPQMVQQGCGRIVITSSITGPRTGNPGLAHYAATKAGINGFIRTAAIEFAKHGITINAVEPGNIMTPGMEDQLGAQYIRAQEQSIPMGKLGDPQDIAYAMLFLAGDEAKYITGQTIVVDGGQTLPESRFAVS
jgi:3-oxoacyl-[acyl-carrier protein] reductase